MKEDKVRILNRIAKLYGQAGEKEKSEEFTKQAQAQATNNEINRGDLLMDSFDANDTSKDKLLYQ